MGVPLKTIKLSRARNIAEKYLAMILPLCKRAEIAGSIRRKNPDVKDIEIVAVRDPKKIRGLKDLVDKWYKCKGNILGKYTQRTLPDYGMKLDLFFADEANYGCIMLMRTGPWEFSKRMMSTVTRENGFVQRDGYLWKDDKKVIVASELEWFELMGMKWIPPEKRA